MSYLEAHEVLDRYEDEINRAASDMCIAMGLTEQSNVTYYEQARIFALALKVNALRNAGTHDAWRAVGWTGNLLTLHGKIVRLMNSLFWNNGQAQNANEKPIDNAVDAIVYAGFFVRQYIAKDQYGAPPIFTSKQPVEQTAELSIHTGEATS